MDLPYDVWRHVVSFLPARHVRKLLGVNRILFEIVMDKLYSTLEIRRLDPRTFWILSNLRNPLIAPRVRCLRLHSDFVRDFYSCRHWADTWRALARNALSVASGISVPLWHHFRSTVHIGGSQSIRVSLNDLTTMLINALPALSNLSEFEDYHLYPTYDMKRFYYASFEVLGSNLRKLTLQREISSFSEVLKYAPHFPRLQELRLLLRQIYLNFRDSSVELRDFVAPFINRHRSTIQTLWLVSLWPIDLSPLFFALETFSALLRLEIRISSRYVSWSCLSGLPRLLRDHMGTLQHVAWEVIGDRHPGSPPLRFGTWLLDNAVVFGNLRTFVVDTVNDEDFEAILVQCRHSAHSLVTLKLECQNFSFDQANGLLSIFSSPTTRLANLRIGAEVMNPDLVLVVSLGLPTLKTFRYARSYR